MIFTFATRCLNCKVCLDLPVSAVTINNRGGVQRWSYECPACGGWVSREAKPAQLAAFIIAGIVPRQEMAAITEADVERFAAELEAMPSG